MDVLVNLLCKYKFVRLTSCLNKPVVIHCVPGAGKSSCIRELINLDSRFEAYTLGQEDPPNLTGVRIRKYKGVVNKEKFNILDEYTLGELLPCDFYAYFGDPIQSNLDNVRPAAFICRFSHRFGKATASLLRDLGFDVEASGEDIVQISGIYSVDPRDVVLYHEEEVGCLLSRHSVEAYHIKEVTGQTFESTTYVTSFNNASHKERAEAFQCLTRHRRRLLILCPDATYGST